MPSVIEDLAATPPTEFGGPNAWTGFAYQRSWAVCMLIELHKAEGDYLVVCDYHDDVLVLEGGLAADHVDFYQIKTTRKRLWTLQRLLQQGKGMGGDALPSVLGKLFRHKQRFRDRARTLAVVCNLPFSIDIREGADATEGRFTFEALADADQQRVLDGIKAELALEDSPDIGVSLAFVTSTLNLTDHENGARGRLEEMLRTRFPDREQFPVEPIFKALADEIERLSRHKDACRSVADIVTLKAFQRKQLEAYIVGCIARADRRNPSRVLTEVSEELRADGMPFPKRTRVTRALNMYCLERMDKGRADLARLATEAEAFVKEGLPERRFTEVLQEGLVRLRSAKEAQGFTDDYLLAVVAWEVIANGDWKLPAAPEKPEEEEA